MTLRPRSLLVSALACVLACAAPSPAQPLERSAKEQDPAKLGVGTIAKDLTLTPLTGQPQSLSAFLAGKKGAVLLMTSTGCPISRKYAPRVAALEREFAKSGVAFVFVNAVESETSAEMGEHAREVGFQGPYVPDRDLAISRAIGARTTSEVFLLAPDRRVAYRGAIDDQYAVGAVADAPKRTFLREAIAALLEGREPAIRATWAPGCLIDIEPVLDAAPGPAASAPAESPAARAPTYFGGVASILAANCVSCHRNGGVAPFGFESAGLIQGRARMVEAVIRDGLMPPTHGTPTGPSGPADASFLSPRGLSPADRETLLAWLRVGRPLGDPAPTPTPPPIPQTWRIGTPDTMLITPGVDLLADGPMQHLRAFVPTGQANDRWVGAIEFRAQPPTAVHHALVWLLPPGSSVPTPGELPPSREFLGAFSVSDNIITFPEGVARKIPAGSLLLVDVYARPMGKRMFASLRVAMKDAPPPATQTRSLVLSPREFRIPADTTDARVRVETTLEGPVRISAISPVMRSRGSAFTLEALRPDGTKTTLLDLPRYDWRWQIRFALREPVDLPAGTKLIATGVFNNSEGNPARLVPHAEGAMGVNPADEAMLAILELLELAAR